MFQNDPTRGLREGTGIFLSQVLSDFGCELLPQISTPQNFLASIILKVLRHRDQVKVTGSHQEHSEKVHYLYVIFVYERGNPTKSEEEKWLFKRWCWDKWLSIWQKVKLVPYFTLYTKIESRWTKDLNVKRKNMYKLWINIFMKSGYGRIS